VLGDAARAMVCCRNKRSFLQGSLLMRALRMMLPASIMLLASPALAQIPPVNLLQDNKPAKTQDEKDAESARDKAYKDSLKKIPDAKQPADPWGGVRSDAPAKSASSSKPKPKASGTAN